MSNPSHYSNNNNDDNPSAYRHRIDHHHHDIHNHEKDTTNMKTRNQVIAFHRNVEKLQVATKLKNTTLQKNRLLFYFVTALQIIGYFFAVGCTHEC